MHITEKDKQFLIENAGRFTVRELSVMTDLYKNDIYLFFRQQGIEPIRSEDIRKNKYDWEKGGIFRAEAYAQVAII